MLHPGYSPANHNHIWIEDVNYVGQSARQTIFEPLNCLRSCPIPRSEICNDLARSLSRARHTFIVPGNSSARDPHLHTSSLPAVACGPRRLLGFRPRQRIVSPFARDSVRPVVDAPLQSHSASASSPQNHTIHKTHPSSSAIGSL